jgi:hypothetical protein
MKHELGSAPIVPEYREKMNCVARALDEVFNGDLKGKDRTVGFVLLVFPFGDIEGRRCNYISNGADRSEIVKLLREQANRFDTETQ